MSAWFGLEGLSNLAGCAAIEGGRLVLTGTGPGIFKRLSHMIGQSFPSLDDLKAAMLAELTEAEQFELQAEHARIEERARAELEHYAAQKKQAWQGEEYDPAHTTQDVAGIIRGRIKAAKKAGRLPEKATFTVKASRGMIYIRGWVATHPEVKAELERIAASFNRFDGFSFAHVFFIGNPAGPKWTPGVDMAQLFAVMDRNQAAAFESAGLRWGGFAT